MVWIGQLSQKTSFEPYEVLYAALGNSAPIIEKSAHLREEMQTIILVLSFQSVVKPTYVTKERHLKKMFVFILLTDRVWKKTILKLRQITISRSI